MDLFKVVRRINNIDEFLSAVNSEDIKVINHNHANLLHEAIVCNKPYIVIELIRRQIDVNLPDNRGMTPLHYTAWYHSPEIAKIILDNGADPSIRDNYGNTSLWYAVFFSKGKHYDLIALLMEAGADPASKNLQGKSPYDFAMQIKDDRLARILTTNYR